MDVAKPIGIKAPGYQVIPAQGICNRQRSMDVLAICARVCLSYTLTFMRGRHRLGDARNAMLSIACPEAMYLQRYLAFSF